MYEAINKFFSSSVYKKISTDDVMSTSSVFDVNMLGVTHGSANNITDNGSAILFQTQYLIAGDDLIYNNSFCEESIPNFETMKETIYEFISKMNIILEDKTEKQEVTMA